MTSDERLAVAEEVFEKCRTIMTGKGREYSRGEEDCLSNFKRAGEAIGIDPLKIAFVYMAKHWDSITSFVKTGQTFSEESIEGRYQDLINYAIIHLALIREARSEASPIDWDAIERAQQSTGRGIDGSMKKDEAVFTAAIDGAACPVPGTPLVVPHDPRAYDYFTPLRNVRT